MSEFTAVLLVGGEATRLHPLSRDIPKALLPVKQIPLIEYMFHQFNRVGVNSFELIAAKKHQKYWSDYQKSLDFKIKIHYETKKYDTGGYICNNLNLFPEKFICANGDLLMNLNLDHFVQTIEEGSSSLLSTIEVEDPSRFGLVLFDKQNYISKFIEKPKDASLGNTISAGLYYLYSKDIEKFTLNKIGPRSIKAGGPVSFEREIFPFLSDYSLLKNCSLAGELFDIGTRESFIGAHCTDGKFWAHPSSTIHEPVTITNSVIMENAIIGESSILKNSIIGPGVKLNNNSTIEDEIVC
tara:strand:- start:2566 stop:3456 length:891 start_codon:yes stop_codon:yes gene_type:complete